MSETIQCRAHLDDDCYEGSPMSRQMPGEDEPVKMDEDGTYDGASIVCDACYLKLMPLTRSGAACYDELPEAISVYRGSVEFLRKQEDPAKFVAEAERAIAMASPGSPYHSSAHVMKRLAEAEVARRVTS